MRTLYKISEFSFSNLISEYKLQTFKCNEKSFRLMFNKLETTLSALVVSAILVGSFFAIGFVQQGSNMSSGGGNTTSAGSNMGNGPSTSGGQMTGGGY
jgi:hypothetical protein